MDINDAEKPISTKHQTMAPEVAIAILNYNGLPLLQRFLPFVLAATYPNKTIWVIDNCSTDDSVLFLQATYPDINVVKNTANLGFAEGYNQGLQQIESEYYLLLNNDVQPTPGFIEPVIALMEANKCIAFAQPKLLNLNLPDHFEYAGAAGGLADAIGYPFCRGRVLEHIEKDDGRFNDNTAVFWATGACLFARATVYKELHGMYSFLYMQNEDIDLCWRAQNRGYQVFACGHSVVYHVGGGSLAWGNAEKTFYTFRNNLTMITRNMPLARLVWVIPLRMLIDGMAAFRYMVKKQPKHSLAVFRGIAAYWHWLFSWGNYKWPAKRGMKNCKGVMNKILVWQYFVRGHETYHQLIGRRKR